MLSMGGLFTVALVFCMAAHAAHATQAVPERLIYPGQGDRHRSDYTIELLELALSKSGEHYDLQASGFEAPKGRNFNSLANNSGIDVLWSMTTKERESSFRAIRIPILKGLIGYRLALIHSNQPDRFKTIDQLQELKPQLAGQLHVWTDARILRENQLSVVPGSTYEGLFKMLASGRIDYFPRSVNEIWSELDAHPGMNLEVDRHLLIHYPTAMYFFVNKKRQNLAEAIERGLEVSLADGSFDRLFYQYHQETIRRSKLAQRNVIHLRNVFLPEDTPLHIKRYWLDPEVD